MKRNILISTFMLFVFFFQLRLEAEDTIYFYYKDSPYYELTNFFENWRKDGLHPVYYLNQKWKSSEHAFQAEKFNYHSKEAQAIRTLIKKASSAREAFDIAQCNNHLARKDWHQIKDEVMLEILRKKFADHHLSNVLKKTGNRSLVEASPYDAYWGYGPDMTGKNRLGELLMQVRYEKFGF